MSSLLTNLFPASVFEVCSNGSFQTLLEHSAQCTVCNARYIQGFAIAGFTLFFTDHAQILTQCKTFPHPKFAKEIPLNAENITVFNGKKKIFRKS